MKAISFDIETIPQPEELSEIQQAELDKKVKRKIANTDMEEDEARSLIMGTSPYFGKIICIGMYRVMDNEKKTAALTGPEDVILKNFWTAIDNFGGIFVSYNGIKFDVPFIVKRSMKHEISPTNPNFMETNPYNTFPHFDVQRVLANFDRYNMVTLRLACDLLDVPSPKEGDIKAKDVEKAYHNGRIQDIADYCVRDVISTFEVYKRIKDFS